MASAVPKPENDRIRFESREEISGVVEAQLKSRYGRGVYTHDIQETPSGNLIINIGNVVPKDLSDCREKDHVIKFVPIDRIYQLQAERVDDGFLLMLPDREDVIEGFRSRQDDLVNQIDLTMAHTIYDDILQFGEVHNQLAPIRQILHWARTRAPIHREEINRNQRSDQTLDYIRVLEQLGYLSVDKQGMVHSGESLDALDLKEVDSEDFNEVVLGDVVRRGYDVLKERLDLGILSHYPRISGAYYYDAVQREDPDLWLDLDAIQDNVQEQFGNRFKKLYLEEKLAQLSRIDVIEKDGDFVRSEVPVYNNLQKKLAITG